MQEDLEVTGISRSGRVRKKSSKLMDFESPDDIETRFRRQTPVKSFNQFRSDEQEFMDNTPPPPRPMEEGGTASGSESDYYENNAENPESMESDSSSDEFSGTVRTPANSLYMMEKSAKKKLIIKDGKVIGRAKAQRKDKGKTRITAYMMWAKEARNDLLKKHPEMDFSAISKRLGEMWANVNYNERYLWKRKAKRFAIQKEQMQNPTANKVISNSKPRYGQVGRPPANRAPVKQQASPTTPPHQALVTTTPQRSGAISAAEIAAHLRLLGESLAIIGERLKEHEGQIAVSGSVSVLLDTLLCSLAPLLALTRAVPAIAPPQNITSDTLNDIAYIMPGL